MSKFQFVKDVIIEQRIVGFVFILLLTYVSIIIRILSNRFNKNDLGS